MNLDNDIRDLNLECIAYKVCRDEGWGLQQVDRTEKRYRIFLQLFRDHGEERVIAPTKDVDIFWHHHILDTSKYAADCKKLFGKFLHHYPYSGIFGDLDAQVQRERVNWSKDKFNGNGNEEKESVK